MAEPACYISGRNEDLHNALGTLEQKGMQRLVLDLRDNGGGSVDEANRVAEEFLPKGAIVYTAEGRKAEITDTVGFSVLSGRARSATRSS